MKEFDENCRNGVEWDSVCEMVYMLKLTIITHTEKNEEKAEITRYDSL